MKQTIFVLSIFCSLTSFAQINFRLGSNAGESRFGDVNPGGNQNFFFSGSNMNADLIFYLGRIGLGARYTKMDTIKGYQVNSSTQSSSSYETIMASSARILNSGLSGLVTLRFYESAFDSEMQIDKSKTIKLPAKTFGELVLSGGKSNQFQMITKDDVGVEANYTATNVDNYSASLLAGFQLTVFQLGLEAGYREMHVHNAKSNAGIVDREDAYKIGYPFVGATLGFGF